MKHLVLFSSLCILLLASCTKQELILPQETKNATPNQAVELSKGDLAFNQIKSNYIKDDTPIFYHYFLDGEALENGNSYDINDQGLWVQLIVTSGMKKGSEILNYEFHAFTDQYEFTYWAKERNILVNNALDITSTLAANPNNSEARQKFEQNGELPASYNDYVKNLTNTSLISSLGNVELAPLNFVFFRNTISNGAIYKADEDCMPIFNAEWNDAISAVQGNNMFLPTVLFEDDFYQNRMNPMIINKSGHAIVFEGPLEELNGKVSSVF